MKAVIILIWKTCDQIQMLMDIPEAMNPVHDFCQPGKIHCSVDCTDSVRICGLYSDLQLDQPRAHGTH